MCQIVCEICNKPIEDDLGAYQIRQGFMEKSDFIPEQDISYFHTECVLKSRIIDSLNKPY